MCAYANNQHDIDGDVVANPEESSFVKAIEAVGSQSGKCAKPVIIAESGQLS